MTYTMTVSPRAKSVRIDDFPDEAWTYLRGGGDPDEEGVIARYQRVPWLYRAMQLRMSAVSTMPYGLFRGDSEVDLSGFPYLEKLAQLLAEIELDLCLTGAAYTHIVRNRAMVKQLRRFVPSSIRPIYDEADGLTGFERKVGRSTVFYKPDELIYFWEPNPTAELGPGPGCGMVALAAAGLIDNADIYAKAYFKRGAIPAVLLAVDGMPSDTEMRRLEAWWKRMLAGVKKAFETVAVRANVKPQVIGSPMKDLAMPELSQAKREDIAIAAGIPMSVLFSDAANFATAQVDERSLYTKTIIPRCAYIAERLSKSAPLVEADVEFRFKPQDLEIFQAFEAEKAVALMGLVAGGVMTKNELRQQMGLKPLDGLDTPVDPEALAREQMDREDARAAAANQAPVNRPDAPQRGKMLKLAAPVWTVEEDEIEDILAERLRLLNEPA